MISWQEELLQAVDGATSADAVFDAIMRAASVLEFEFCAYGLRVPMSFTRPEIILCNNYPERWQTRYLSAGYLDVDPTVAHGRRSQTPILWGDDGFARAPDFWDDARSNGVRFGWAQSSLDGQGMGGMLTLARSATAIGRVELGAKLQGMQWLTHVAHLAMTRTHRPDLVSRFAGLTAREVEVLKWTADGKSSQDIADILSIGKRTVDFHVSNCIVKLNVANKTAAAVRAAMLGLLN